MTPIVAWDTGDGGPRVLVIERNGRAAIRIEDGRGRYLVFSPGRACEVASGIDQALTRIVRRDGLARSA